MKPRTCGLFSCLLLTILGFGSQPAQAQVWSPDGQWLAYTLPRQPAPLSPPRYLAALLGQAELPAVSDDPWATNRAGGTRLWATRIETRESVVLEEIADGWLTEPSWSRDGRSLAYGRLVAGKEGSETTFELVIRESLEKARVVKSWPCPALAPADSERLTWSVAWSPDGRRITAPYFGPQGPGVQVVSTRDGSVERQFDAGAYPRWSPSGSALAFQVIREISVPGSAGSPARVVGPGTALWHRDSGELVQIKSPRPPLSRVSGPPAWTADGRTVQFAACRPQEPVSRIEILIVGGVAATPGRTSPGRELGIPVNCDPGALLSFQMAADSDDDSLYTAHAVDGMISVLSWFRGTNGAVFKRFNPFDQHAPMVALAASPRQDARLLAFRVVSSAGVSPPAITDLEAETFEPVVPDAAARQWWKPFLLMGILKLVGEPPGSQGQLDALTGTKPSVFPAPGEFVEEHPVLRRLDQLGKRLEQMAPESPDSAHSPMAGDPPIVRLIAALSTRKYAAAEAALDELDDDSEERIVRYRLRGLRAQICLERGQADRAWAILESLTRDSLKTGSRVEDVNGRGVVSAPVAPEGLAWVERFSRRMQPGKAETAEPSSERVTPFGLPGEVVPGDTRHVPFIIAPPPGDIEPPQPAGVVPLR